MLGVATHQKRSSSSSSSQNSTRGRHPLKSKHRPTALSSFVTKKRASSRSSSTSSDQELSSTAAKKLKIDTQVQEPTSTKTKTTMASSQTRSSKKGKGKGKGKVTGSTMLGKSTSQGGVVSVGVSHLRANTVGSVGKAEYGLSAEREVTRVEAGHPIQQASSTDNGVNGASGVLRIAPEDDQISISSSTVNSGQGSKVSVAQGSGSTSTHTSRSGTSQPKTSSAPPNIIKSTFKFEEMFSFFPPKLVVRNGELVPEQSLSVKHLDKQGIANLPASHPFRSWTLGQPTRSTGKCPRKRKAGNSKTVSSSAS